MNNYKIEMVKPWLFLVPMSQQAIGVYKTMHIMYEGQGEYKTKIYDYDKYVIRGKINWFHTTDGEHPIWTQNYLVFGLCPLPGILKTTEHTGLRLAFSKGPYRICVSPTSEDGNRSSFRYVMISSF
jgi:hypothetical protein